MGNAQVAPPSEQKVPESPANTQGSLGPEDGAKPKKKICCACPETKKLRDECIIEHGEDKCGKFIEAHKQCLRAEGFNVWWIFWWQFLLIITKLGVNLTMFWYLYMNSHTDFEFNIISLRCNNKNGHTFLIIYVFLCNALNFCYDAYSMESIWNFFTTLKFICTILWSLLVAMPYALISW